MLHRESCVINQASSEFIGLGKGVLCLARDKFISRLLLGSKLMPCERKVCSEVKIVVEDP